MSGEETSKTEDNFLPGKKKPQSKIHQHQDNIKSSLLSKTEKKKKSDMFLEIKVNHMLVIFPIFQTIVRENKISLFLPKEKL